ncbi:MAG: Hsp20/alpha crystallin family protein [Chloroflexi bacterium]|nr:Hsp20/alpha crystallin family protein [Chloroflexota bacterium]
MGEERGKEKDNSEDQQGKEPQGVTGGALRGLGKIIPGFGELVKGLEKSEAFQERLKAADAEIERQLEKAPPLKRVEGTRRSIIPPKTTLKASRTTLREEAAVQPPQREVTTDIFDEGDCLKVIAELPGVDEKDIKTEVKDNLLILSAQATGRAYYKEIELPCLVRDELSSTYKNGILQITMEKEQI